MKIKNLIDKIEKIFPLKSSYDFDNSGKNIIDGNASIKNVLVCVDINNAAIEYAIKNDVNLIISHHPMIFSKIKNINEDYLSTKIKKLIVNNINAYSLHTNYDVNIKDGMGTSVLYKLFSKNEISESELIENIDIDIKKYGIGNIISLKNKIKIESIIKKLISKLNINENRIKVYTANKNAIEKIIIIPGSGSGFVDDVIIKKPDCLITSDLKHNQIVDLVDNGITYIDATHYGLEKIFIENIEKILIKLITTKIFVYYDDRLM